MCACVQVVECAGSDGVRYKQLVKGKDDMRQDAVMQQVCVVVLCSRSLSSCLIVRAGSLCVHVKLRPETRTDEEYDQYECLALPLLRHFQVYDLCFTLPNVPGVPVGQCPARARWRRTTTRSSYAQLHGGAAVAANGRAGVVSRDGAVGRLARPNQRVCTRPVRVFVDANTYTHRAGSEFRSLRKGVTRNFFVPKRMGCKTSRVVERC